MIDALSYVVISTPAMAAWLELARDLVGLHPDGVVPGQSVRLRMDAKHQRLVLRPVSGAPALAMGYTVSGAPALARVADALRSAGYALHAGSADEIALRGLSGMFHFRDPDGNRIEIGWGLADSAEPLRPGRPIGGFRTGDLGLGHVALKCGDFAAMRRLYRETLQFRLSDYGQVPFAAEFLHVNARHHSLGLADTGTGAGVYHLMLEYREWDDVGRAYDMALGRPDAIGVSLGRHINDHVTSFYLKTPDGWLLELGWAGRLIGPDWTVSELPGYSLWGHDRPWLPAAQREQGHALLRELAARGVRAPVVLPEPRG
jgi:2,3-dihydroxybiphenyl 1,2-dioxygenase